jgi:hypothetical protein
MHKAVKPAHMFINRIISLLRQMGKPRSSIAIDSDMYRDLNWFIKCASQCNGTVKIDKHFFLHIELFIDTSKTGLGACWGNNVYQLSLGLRGQENIAVLEANNIVVALRVWAVEFKNKAVRVWCDNTAAVTVLNLGRGCDPIMQSIARNVLVAYQCF